mmetsp:Transcript_18833/g.44391  ORF Transcript_18833/g.44391 Transcript_18833/m.44391 type:complete len:248 (-) Transcript_18833:96-839(-)
MGTHAMQLTPLARAGLSFSAYPLAAARSSASRVCEWCTKNSPPLASVLLRAAARRWPAASAVVPAAASSGSSSSHNMSEATPSSTPSSATCTAPVSAHLPAWARCEAGRKSDGAIVSASALPCAPAASKSTSAAEAPQTCRAASCTWRITSAGVRCSEICAISSSAPCSREASSAAERSAAGKSSAAPTERTTASAEWLATCVSSSAFAASLKSAPLRRAPSAACSRAETCSTSARGCVRVRARSPR